MFCKHCRLNLLSRIFGNKKFNSLWKCISLKRLKVSRLNLWQKKFSFQRFASKFPREGCLIELHFIEKTFCHLIQKLWSCDQKTKFWSVDLNDLWMIIWSFDHLIEVHVTIWSFDHLIEIHVTIWSLDQKFFYKHDQ